LTVIPDFAANLRGHPSAVDGYALMTFGPKGDHVAWRVYDAIPADAVLAKDMADALEGRLGRLMSWRDGKANVNIGALRPKVKAP
ncbi:MAG: hypothetical protein Q8R82_14935, partial [Hyphomonadaceae bacterium]|nr:hypothetical protein [Hyphomonadaceae bacterium]